MYPQPSARWPDPLVVRRLLTWYIVSARRPVTVAEIVGWLIERGFRPPGRASKVVSDRLRADTARGRIRRIGRGRYVGGQVPATTWHRMQTAARAALQAADACRAADVERTAARVSRTNAGSEGGEFG